MATEAVLRERRERARQREQHVEEMLQAKRMTLAELGSELDEERDEREELHKRRKDLREAIEKEIKADERGRGERPEKWEDWANARRDEIADLIDATEARIERLIVVHADTREQRRELAKRDRHLEHRIEIIERKLERKEQGGGQLTKDFHVAEFDCRNGVPVPTYMYRSLRDLCVAHLQPLRDSGGSVSINSGYRTAAYNASIGGATASYHIYDLRKTAPAADHIQAGRSATAVQAWHEANNPFDGMGHYVAFTHGDDRGYYSRWWGAA